MNDSAERRSHWRVCSICRTPIPFEGTYWRCSVSTCNRSRTALSFCSVACWDAHVPTMRHRDAWAEEARAPSRAVWEAEEQAHLAAEQRASTRKIERPTPEALRTARPTFEPSRPAVGSASGVGGTSEASPREPAPLSPDTPDEILVVVSKLKAYVKARSDLKTSDGVMPVLSDILRDVCDEAIRRARAAGRLTILDRDLPRRWRPVD